MIQGIRPLSAAAALFLAWGCAGWGETVTVMIESRPLSAETARHESIARLESGDRVIRVRRAIRVPDACRELSGQVARAGDYLSLRVTPLPSGDRCAPSEAYLAYTATIEGVSPGQYRLRVVHGYPGERRRSEVVLEHPVFVPSAAAASGGNLLRKLKPWN